MMTCDCCKRSFYGFGHERICAYCLQDRISATRFGLTHTPESHGAPRWAEAARARSLPAKEYAR